MGIGTSVFLLAVGAVLTWAVHATVQGLDLHVLGVILMVVGAIGLAVSLLAVRRAYVADDVLVEPVARRRVLRRAVDEAAVRPRRTGGRRRGRLR